MAWDIRHERPEQSTRQEPDPPHVWGPRHEPGQRQAWNPRHVPDPRYSRDPRCLPDYVPNPRYSRGPRHVSDYAPDSSCPRDTHPVPNVLYPSASQVYQSPDSASLGRDISELRPNVTFNQEPQINSEQQWYMLQQRNNEAMVAANFQLAAAMSLPKVEVSRFKGDPMEYKSFVKAFDARIESKIANSADRLYYLNQHLVGEPKELIGGCLYLEPDLGYSEARKLLDSEYGDSYKISTAYVKKVLYWPMVKYDDVTGLKRFVLFLKKVKNAMCAIADMSVLNHPTNMQIIVKKLPASIQNKWRDRVTKMKRIDQRIAQFQDLVTFVDECSESANHPVYGKEVLGYKRTDNKDKTKLYAGENSISFATKVGVPGQPVTPEKIATNKVKREELCPCCNKSHQLDDCDDFIKNSIEARKSLLKEKKLCFSCYGQNHIARGCLQKKTCKSCGKKHPTALHIPDFQFKKRENEQKINNGYIDIPAKENKHRDGVGESIIYHTILPVRIKEKGSRKSIETYAFYDNGSGGSFMTEKLQNQLGVKGVKTALQLGTMHGRRYVNSNVLTNLIVTDLNDRNPIEINKVFTREFIPVDHNQIPTPEIVSKWKNLESVAKDIPGYRPNLEIGLLIGNNCILAHEPLNVISSTGNGPFAVLLRHGWSVGGPVSQEPTHPDAKNVNVNRITIREIESVKEIVTPQLLLDALALDFNEHNTGGIGVDGKGFSQEDKLFMKKVEKGTRLSDGHYEIPLPFRNENVVMPNNKSQVIKRADLQRKKMLKDPNYRKDYTTFMTDVIAKGYAEKVLSHSAEEGKVWYIPHHGVYHPKKPGKIRVVFDCSSRFHGTSINDELLPGPNLTNTLTGVLTRFRQDPIGFMADIEAMFYQVRVPISQRNYLRFLWWPNGDLSSSIEEYRMTVHLFGAVSSPACSNDLRQSCAKGGFRLTKFCSNSRVVLQSIPEEERSKELKNLDLQHERLPLERALGVYWNIESDDFEFRVTLNSKPATRRGVLSVVSSVYDPLGFVAPFILPAKKILQELCQEKQLDWDDEIPIAYQNRWSKWKDDLHILEQLLIKRSLIPPDFGKIVSRQFHVFSDASFTGYGAVAYLRLKDDNGQIHCAFLMGKSRLTPSKVVTIPRLELVAATLSARLGRLLDDEVEEKPDNIIFHTDSTTVLRYIQNEQTRFHVFVANRLQVIRDLTELTQWRYVQSNENPADHASRGMDGRSVLQQRKWMQGPDFLWQNEHEWPQQPITLSEVANDDPEVKKAVNISAVSVDDSMESINKFFEFYSDWHRLKRAVAVMLRLRRLLMERELSKQRIRFQCEARPKKRREPKRSAKLKVISPPITAQELQKAEEAILKCLQTEVYGNEISVINDTIGTERRKQKERKSGIKRSSSIYRLSPFLSQGILCVGGRLSNADISESAKHPCILPRRSHITTLIIRDIHKRLGHAGRGHVLAVLREKYWVIGASAAVRHCLHKCVFCRRFRAVPAEQRMANLPKERVNPAPPFTYVGVDYFGPFHIKERRSVLKRYGAPFTCLVSRAIHIEVSNTLNTDSFLQALRRFVARRGPVRQIRCDNGTNFIGAKSELDKAFSEMDQSVI